jgi:YVTN family beta-propeller protein
MKSLAVFSGVSLLGLSLVLLACSGGSTPAPVAIAYVAHAQSHSLSVINIPADKTVSRIEIGNSSSSSLAQAASYPQRVAVTPDGSRVYVTDGSTSVWVVDTMTNSPIVLISAGIDPEEVAIAPDGRTAYVTSITCGDLLCSGPSKPAQMASVEVIDTATYSLTATITLGNSPEIFLSGIAVSPDGTRVYVTQNTAGTIWVIDTATNSGAVTISTGSSGLTGVAFSPDGQKLYAVGWTVANTNFVDVIDTQTNAVRTSIALGNTDRPVGIAITPDGGHAYVVGAEGHVWVVDTIKNTTVNSLTVSYPNGLRGVAITPDGTRAYLTCGNKDTIYVLDTASNSVVDRLRSDFPGGLAISRAR